MQQKVISGLFFIVLLNLVVKPYYIFGIDAEIQIRVGEVAYGNYFALLNFSYLFNILLDVGISNYNTRNIAKHPQLIQKHFYKLLGIRFGLFILYSLTTFCFALILGYHGEEFYLLLILVLNQFLVSVVQFCRSNFGGLHLFKTDAFISILDRALLIIFCLILFQQDVFKDENGIYLFAWIQTFAYGISAIISLSILYSKTGKIKLKLSKAFSVVVIKQSLPYALLILLMMMYNRMDAIMLERMLPDGDYHAGIYAQGYRFLDAVNMFALLFAGILLPVFARIIHEKKSLQDQVNFSFRVLMGISVVIGITCSLYSLQVLNLRYNDVQNESTMSFMLLILSFIPVSVTYIYGTLLTANGSLKQLNQMAIVGLITNLILNLLLIPTYKASGAALATLITQSLTALIQFILAHKILGIHFNKLLGAKLLLLSVMIVGFYFVLSSIELNENLKFVLTLVLGIFTYVILGFVKKDDLRMLMNR